MSGGPIAPPPLTPWHGRAVVRGIQPLAFAHAPGVFLVRAFHFGLLLWHPRLERREPDARLPVRRRGQLLIAAGFTFARRR